MAGWMSYTLLTTLLLAIAGTAGERVARALRVPTRLVWMAVIAMAMALSALALLGRRSVAVTEGRSRVVGEAVRSLQPLPPTPIGTAAYEEGNLPGERAEATRARGQPTPGRGTVGAAIIRLDDLRWHSYDPILAAIAALLALAGMLVVMISVVRLQRMMRTLESTQLAGASVLLSRDLGPAVIGFLRPRVVIPRWVTTLPTAERSTIVLHEQEHASARDPMLALLGIAALALQPWNVPLWIVVAQLRFALEADCDARVLRRSRYGAGQYGKLLLHVHEREQVNGISSRLPVTAFVDAISHLERRVRRMTERKPAVRSVSTIAALAGLVLCVGLAVSVRVSRAGESTRMRPHVLLDAHISSARMGTTTATLGPVATSGGSELAVLPSLGNPLPRLVNSEHEVPHAPLRVKLPTRLPAQSSATMGETRSVQAVSTAETLFVRSSNPIWPMKARIIFTDATSAERVVVTDRLGHRLPAADTLVVDGPIQLALPEPPYHMSFESLAGDLSITTSPMTAPDRKSRWVGTVLGRHLLAWRDVADAAIKVTAKGPGYVKGQRVP
jgi:hypothetical protein